MMVAKFLLNPCEKKEIVNCPVREMTDTAWPSDQFPERCILNRENLKARVTFTYVQKCIILDYSEHYVVSFCLHMQIDPESLDPFTTIGGLTAPMLTLKGYLVIESNFFFQCVNTHISEGDDDDGIHWNTNA